MNLIVTYDEDNGPSVTGVDDLNLLVLDYREMDYLFGALFDDIEDEGALTSINNKIKEIEAYAEFLLKLPGTSTNKILLSEITSFLQWVHDQFNFLDTEELEKIGYTPSTYLDL
jgi:hypothetical protein